METGNTGRIGVVKEQLSWLRVNWSLTVLKKRSTFPLPWGRPGLLWLKIIPMISRIRFVWFETKLLPLSQLCRIRHNTDNGAPFGSIRSLGRLSRLSVWFMELGIKPVFSDPAHPEQNGRHERMHRELKGEATRPPGYNIQLQQRKLNSFIREYNEVRPSYSFLN